MSAGSSQIDQFNTVDSTGPLELSGEPLPKVEILEVNELAKRS